MDRYGFCKTHFISWEFFLAVKYSPPAAFGCGAERLKSQQKTSAEEEFVLVAIYVPGIVFGWPLGIFTMTVQKIISILYALGFLFISP